MCGELDDEDTPGCARAASRRSFSGDDDAGPPSSIDAYMDQLFAAALKASLQDLEAATLEERFDTMMAQPVVFARLAGFLAGQINAAHDPLRQVLDALMTGYEEAAQSPAAPRRGSSHHDHGHDHDHGH
jgi:hypothetical protein